MTQTSNVWHLPFHPLRRLAALQILHPLLVFEQMPGQWRLHGHGELFDDLRIEGEWMFFHLHNARNVI